MAGLGIGNRGVWVNGFLAIVTACLLLGLGGCGRSEKIELVQPLEPEENVAAASKGALPISSSSQNGYPVSNLTDATPAPWGAAEGNDDVYAAVVLPAPQAIHELRIWVFSPADPPRQHLRDIRVLAADSEQPGGPKWHVVRSRLSKNRPYSEKVTIPVEADGSVVRVEIDPSDSNGGSHKIWGFGCFTASRGDARNYLKEGTGVYVRELQMK